MNNSQIAFLVLGLVLLAPGLCFFAFGVGFDDGVNLLTVIGVAIFAVAFYLLYRAFSRADR